MARTEKDILLDLDHAQRELDKMSELEQDLAWSESEELEQNRARMQEVIGKLRMELAKCRQS